MTDQPAQREDFLPDPDPKKAAEAALELLKQLIALASGVLALSATFIDKLRPLHPLLHGLLALSWLALIGAVFAGLQAMSATVKAFHRPEFRWTQRRLRGYARTSKYCFLAGISLFALFAFILTASRDKSAASEPPESHSVVYYSSSPEPDETRIDNVTTQLPVHGSGTARGKSP